MRKKKLQIANIISLIAVIVINYLSVAAIFNGTTIVDVSAQYQSYVTPAQYAFSIWRLIYLGRAAFVTFQGRSLFGKEPNNDIAVQIGWWCVLSSIANSLWVLTWVYELTGLSVLMM